MKEETMMRPFDPEEVEPEEAIEQERARARKEEQRRLEQLMQEKREPERDPLKELADLLDRCDAEAMEEIRKAKGKSMRGCVLFGIAAGGVLAAMFGGLIEEVFALPLTAVYLMRAAVKFDRWSRI